MASLVAELRALTPQRPLSLNEGLRIAELQAARLLRARGVTEPAVNDAVVSELPRVQVERLSPIPVSGSAHWSRGRWLIVLNGAEAATRQRFSLMHEFKHVVDAPFIHYLYPEQQGSTSYERGERVADFFSACVLMPRPWVKRIFGRGEHDVAALAERFGVSQAAMSYRLTQIGLVPAAPRCGAAA